MSDTFAMIAKFTSLMEQNAQPETVFIESDFNRDDNQVDVRVTVKIPDSKNPSLPAIEGTQVFTLKPDSHDGFVITAQTESYFSSTGGTSATGLAALLKQQTPAFATAKWFKKAILQATFTRNQNPDDEILLIDKLGFDSPRPPATGFDKFRAFLVDSFTAKKSQTPDYSSPLSKLHILQDALQHVVQGGAYDFDKHLAIAGFLTNLPEDFWGMDAEGNDPGLPFGEIYFTHFWMQQAQQKFLMGQVAGYNGFTRQQVGQISALYEQSLTVLDAILQDLEFPEYCHERPWYASLFGDDATCELYEARLQEASGKGEAKLISDPFAFNSPKTHTEKNLRELGKSAVQLGFNSVAENLRDGDALKNLAHESAEVMTRHPELVAELLDATSVTLQTPKVRQAVANLSVTAVSLAAFIAKNPNLGQALQSLSQTLMELSVYLVPKDPAALLAAIKDSGAQERASEFLSVMLREFLNFSDKQIQEHRDLIVSQAEAITLLGFETARSQKVQDGLEDVLLDYFEFSNQLFSNPEFQFEVSQISKTVANIMIQNAGEVLGDDEFREGLALILAEQIVPYAGIMSNAMQANNEEAVAIMLSHLIGTSMRAGLISFETPELQRTIDRLLDILPLLKEKIKYLLKTPLEQRWYDVLKPQLFFSPFRRSLGAHLHLVQPSETRAQELFDRSGQVEFSGKNSVGLDVKYQVTYHENAKTYMLPQGGMVASLDVRDQNYSVEQVRKALTDVDFRAHFYKDHTAIKDYELVDLTGKHGAEAILVDDGLGFGNKCSFVDIKKRPHYLTYQELIVGNGNPNEEYVLDMWIEKDTFRPGQPGEMVMAWDVLPTDNKELREWREENGLETKNLETENPDIKAWRKKNRLKPGHMTNANFKKLIGSLCEPAKTHRSQNTGVWQIMDTDGDGIVDVLSLGVSLEDAESSPDLFRYQVMDYLTTMALLFKEYPEGE